MDDVLTEPLDDRLAEPGAAEPLTEPRGPHLPDALAGIPRLAWPLILLAAGRLAWAINQADFGPVPELSTVVSYVIGSIPPMVAVLLPVALLTRHPDAASRARTLLVGTVLIAIAEGLRALADPLGPIFEQLTPGSEQVPFLIPMAIGYSTFASLVGTFGIANLALGLAQARWYEDRPGARVTVVGFGIVAVLIAASRIVEVTRLPFDQIPMTPTVIAYIGTTVGLGILAVVAWTYLATTAVRGARAGEEPGSGWPVGALGAGLVVAAYLLGAALSLAAALSRPTPDAQPLFTTLGQLTSGVSALGYLFLIGAFAAGLPSFDEIDDDAIDAIDGDEGDDAADAAAHQAGDADIDGEDHPPV